MNRKLIIAVHVVLLHIAALWAMQNGLLRRALDVIVPAEILTEFNTPPAPRPDPAPPAPPVVRKSTPAPVAAPAPAPVQAEPAPALIATPTQPVAPAPLAPAAPAAPGPAPVRVELPTSSADYLQNPKPAYPALSKRLGEQGKVVVRVLIGVNGSAQRAEISQSSGFERLDQAALQTVLGWRYVPGKRGGVPEAMWFNVPIHFVLE